MPEVSENNDVRLRVGEYLTADRIDDLRNEIFLKLDNVDPLQAWVKLSAVYSIMRISENMYVVITVDLEATQGAGLGHILYKKDEYAFDKIRITRGSFRSENIMRSIGGDSEKTRLWLERWRRP